VGATELRPERWLGATAPGGLALPDARPTPAHLYAPRGVFIDDERIVVADSGNHRILIWTALPERDHAPAAIVLGQPDFTREGPGLLHLPTGVLVHDGKLLVADSWHHRVLVWNRVPSASGVPPDYAIGQRDLAGVEVNAGGAAAADTLYWPYGIGIAGDRFFVADTGNRRVLMWDGIPAANEPACAVLGQPSFAQTGENRGVGVGERSFRWAHDIAGDATRLFVADAGNHRVLGWDAPVAGDAPAALALGQRDFVSAHEFGFGPQSATALRFPYSVAYDGGRLAVADTANNRVLLYDEPAHAGAGLPADAVVGQTDFLSNGENHWKAVTSSTLCWPYGVHLHGDHLAIADSGNNRVMIWSLSRPGNR
jgi:hypothetical protein